MEELLTVIVKIRKQDLDTVINKLGVDEYTVNTKKREVTIDMTRLVSEAVQQYDAGNGIGSESSTF